MEPKMEQMAQMMVESCPFKFVASGVIGKVSFCCDCCLVQDIGSELK